MISANQLNLPAGDSVVVAFAMVAAGSLDEMASNIEIAGMLYYQATSIDDSITLPETHSIITNYPNPFNSNTIIKVDGVAGNENTISIFDVMGRLVKELPISGGSVVWDGTCSNGNSVAAGIYFARISDQVKALKMLLVK